MDKSIIKHVTEGEVLTPVGTLKLNIKVDSAAMRRAAAALEQVKRAMDGEAVRVWIRPDERNVIDQ